MIQVVHVRKSLFQQGHFDCVYIGRDYLEFRDEGWGNPFHLGVGGDRKTVLKKYREWVLKQPHLIARLPELRDKILGCWCKPLSCHGDVLVELCLNFPNIEPLL